MPSIKSLFSSIIHNISNTIIAWLGRASDIGRKIWSWAARPSYAKTTSHTSKNVPVNVTNKHLRNVNQYGKRAFLHDGVKQFMRDGRMTVAQLGRIGTRESSDAIMNLGVRQFIIDGHLTIEQFLFFNSELAVAIMDSDVRQFIIDGHLTIEQFSCLNFRAAMTIKYSEVRQFITYGYLTIEQFLGLNPDAAYALDSCWVLDLMLGGRMTVTQLQRIDTRPLSLAIIHRYVCKLIVDGNLTIEQFLGLNYHAANAVSNPEVCQLISDGRMTVAQLQRIDTASLSLAITHRDVCKLIVYGNLTIEQFLGLNPFAVDTLNNDLGRELILGYRMTVAQLQRINSPQLKYAVTNLETVQMVMAGLLTVDEIIGQRRVNMADNPINGRQSTHTASVHKSASKSASNLDRRYGDKINTQESLNDIVKKLREFFNSLLPNSIMDEENDCVIPAQQAVARITATDFTFVDPASKISARQLLALAYLAIHDSEILDGTIEDAKICLVRGLREVWRGYNLNDIGEDDGREDGAICASGAFNKLINSLQAVHPDCSIVYITKETMIAKLPVLILEEIKKYSVMQKGPAYLNILDVSVIDEFIEHGVEAIWKKIKKSVEKEMLKEFELYDTDASAKNAITDIVKYGKILEFSAPALKKLRTYKEDPTPQPGALRRTFSCKW